MRMIKASFCISAISMVAWIIFLVVMSLKRSFLPSPEDLLAVTAVAAGIAIGTFAISFLGGQIIMRNKGYIRLGILLSVFWVVGNFVSLEPMRYTYKWEDFLTIGFAPLILYWGILWVISGFLLSRNKT